MTRVEIFDEFSGNQRYKVLDLFDGLESAELDAEYWERERDRWRAECQKRSENVAAMSQLVDKAIDRAEAYQELNARNVAFHEALILHLTDRLKKAESITAELAEDEYKGADYE